MQVRFWMYSVGRCLEPSHQVRKGRFHKPSYLRVTVLTLWQVPSAALGEVINVATGLWGNPDRRGGTGTRRRVRPDKESAGCRPSPAESDLAATPLIYSVIRLLALPHPCWNGGTKHMRGYEDGARSRPLPRPDSQTAADTGSADFHHARF